MLTRLRRGANQAAANATQDAANANRATADAQQGQRNAEAEFGSATRWTLLPQRKLRPTRNRDSETRKRLPQVQTHNSNRQ